MKAVFAILLFALSGSVGFARADVIVSGNVQTFRSSDGTACMASGAAPFNLSLNCGEVSNSSPQATVKGTANEFGGSLLVNADAPGFAPSSAMASGGIGISGTYVMTGGSGMATLTFLLSAPEFQFGDQGSISCVFAVDGVSQTCGVLAPVGTGFLGYDLSFAVEYGVPFSVGLGVGRDVIASDGEDTGSSTVTFSLSGPGLTLTPEPSSILLLMPGFAGVIFAARSRARRMSR
jgi:hypothetical protein